MIHLTLIPPFNDGFNIIKTTNISIDENINTLKNIKETLENIEENKETNS